MPPRFAYWTIIAGGLPTSFRASEREDLAPTLRRLQARHPDAVLKWFARGKLWSSPEEALADRAKPAPRGPGWRPGGEHRDPRAKFAEAKKQRNQDRRAERFERKQRSEALSGGKGFEGRKGPEGETREKRDGRELRGSRERREAPGKREGRESQGKSERPETRAGQHVKPKSFASRERKPYRSGPPRDGGRPTHSPRPDKRRRS